MIAAFFAAAFVYLYCTVFLLPATPIFFENDHLIPMYDSVRMMGGEVLYRDIFQFTFPGTQLWYVTLFAAFGERMWLLNATIIFLGLMLSAAIMSISARLMDGVYALVPPAIFLFFGFRWYGMDGGHRLFSCFFATLATLVLIDRSSRSRLVLAGAFSAMATFFTQNRGVGIAAAIVVFIVWEVWSSEAGAKVRDTAMSILIFGMSYSAVLLLLTAHFLISVGPGTFIESTLLFARNYNADPLNNSNFYLLFWQSLLTGNVSWSSLPVDLFYYLLVPAAYIVPLVYYFWKRPGDRRLWRNVVLLCISGICLFLVTTGLNPVRLYHVAIPGVIVLVLGIYHSRLRLVMLPAAGAVVMLAVGLCVWTQIKPYPAPVELPAGTVVFTSEIAGERYRWLNDHTEPGDVVFEPFRTAVNFPLHVRNPTSFAMLRNSDYTTPGHIEMIIGQLEGRPPKYIVWDGNWSLEQGERRPDDHLGPLYDYLRRDYKLAATLSPIYEFKVEVWERKF